MTRGKIFRSILGGLVLFAAAGWSQQVAGLRDLPASYTPGATVVATITINVNEASPPNGFILSETLPAGWTIASSSPEYKKTETAGGRTTYKWLFYGSDVRDRVVTYTANVPSTAAGILFFNGTVAYYTAGGSYVEEAISGDDSINSVTPSSLTVAPASLVFGPAETTQILTVTNSGGSVLNWSASIPSGAGWLSAMPASGALGPGTSDFITVMVDRTGMQSGTYLSSITVSGSTGTATVPVAMVVNRPSSLSNFAAYTAVGGNQLYWTNPAAYTGTIVFRRIGAPPTGGPVDGVEDAAGDTICIFKNTTGATTFYDPAVFVGDTRPYYYRAYSFAGPWYSARSDGTSVPTVPPAQWQYTPSTALNQQLPNWFGVQIPAGAFATDLTVTATEVDRTYAPPVDQSVYGFAHIYCLTYLPQIPLNTGQSAVIRIPAYLDDYTAGPTAAVGDIGQFFVYRWPSGSRGWQRLTDIVDRVEFETSTAPRGYIDVRVSNLTGHDYFALAFEYMTLQGSHGCFVATAAFGTPAARQIQVLRSFRDTRLLATGLGRSFLRFYERHSPALADAIRNRPLLRSLARICLIPAIRVSAFFDR